MRRMKVLKEAVFRAASNKVGGKQHRGSVLSLGLGV